MWQKEKKRDVERDKWKYTEKEPKYTAVKRRERDKRKEEESESPRARKLEKNVFDIIIY